MNIEQLNHYQRKLAYEMDSWDLTVAIREGQNVIVVDGRSSQAYEQEHIPGALSLCHKDICFNQVTGLDKGALYICYCDGIGCNASTKTAMKLMTLGFEVRELIGGMDWWKRDGYATSGSHSQVGTEVVCGC
jgi:rhodanese-related sulfurtransferase